MKNKTLVSIVIVCWTIAAIVASCSLHVQDKPVHHYPPIESPLHNNEVGAAKGKD